MDELTVTNNYIFTPNDADTKKLISFSSIEILNVNMHTAYTMSELLSIISQNRDLPISRSTLNTIFTILSNYLDSLQSHNVKEQLFTLNGVT